MSQPVLESVLFSLVLLAGCGPGGGDPGLDAAPGGVDAAPTELAGEWGRGGWLTAGGQFAASSSLTLTLSGTTVGGTARLSGTAPSPLTGTFDGTRMLGMCRSTEQHTLDLALNGGYLVGPYTGSIDAIATFVADAAPPAPALPPAKLVGRWKSSKTASGGAFTLTITGAPPNPAGHITAPGLVDDDVSLGYQERVLHGLASISQLSLQLFGSGTRFVGSYGFGTDYGVIDVVATP